MTVIHLHSKMISDTTSTLEMHTATTNHGEEKYEAKTNCTKTLELFTFVAFTFQYHIDKSAILAIGIQYCWYAHGSNSTIFDDLFSDCISICGDHHIHPIITDK